MWTQYLGLQGLMRLIYWSFTWIVDLDEEILLVWSWLKFQDDCHINRVEVKEEDGEDMDNRDAELIELVN